MLPIRLTLSILMTSFALPACGETPPSWRVLLADGQMVAVVDKPREIEGAAESFTVNLATARFYPASPGEGYDVVTMEVDCPGRLMGTTRMASYSADGSLHRSFDSSSPKERVVEASPGEKVFEAVCENKYIIDMRYASLNEFLLDVRSRVR